MMASIVGRLGGGHRGGEEYAGGENVYISVRKSHSWFEIVAKLDKAVQANL